MELPYDSVIPFLDIYPEKTIIQKDTFNVLAALFTITRTWKQPKCPSTEEWIKKMWYIYAINVSLVKSLSHVRLFATPWTIYIAHQAPLSMWILQARILEWVAMPSSFQGIYPKKIIIQKDKCTQVYCSTIYNNQDMAAT